MRAREQKKQKDALRDHSAFLNGYAPEDEGLYEDGTPVPEGLKENSRGLSEAKRTIPPVLTEHVLHPEGVSHFTSIFEPALEGGYTCHFAELPEVFSEGESIEEARENLFDALNQVTAYYRQTLASADKERN